MLYSCEEADKETVVVNMETLVSQSSDSLVIIASENGRISYRFKTPLMENYEFAREPYMEFRRGIEIETFDSLGNIDSRLIADYAISYEKLKLWEAKGNVKATNSKGQLLETQQLFWNQRTRKVYSNVDSKVTQDGDVIIGEGFESDENFDDFVFRRPRGKVTMDVDPTENPDGEEVESPRPLPQPVQEQKQMPAPSTVNGRPKFMPASDRFNRSKRGQDSRGRNEQLNTLPAEANGKEEFTTR